MSMLTTRDGTSIFSKDWVYPGGSHGLANTRAEEFNADLLAFIQSGARYASASEGGRHVTH